MDGRNIQKVRIKGADDEMTWLPCAIIVAFAAIPGYFILKD